MLAARMKRELELLEKDPPFGVAAWVVGDSFTHLHASMCGPSDTPYAKGVFHLDIRVPQRYPFEPPEVRFETPVYHPNIDSGGRICLDTLKMPPKGAWTPSLNISSVLATIHLLLSEPNPEDGLMADITDQFRHNKAQFLATAEKWTERHAMQQKRKADDDDEEGKQPHKKKLKTPPKP